MLQLLRLLQNKHHLEQRRNPGVSCHLQEFEQPCKRIALVLKCSKHLLLNRLKELDEGRIILYRSSDDNRINKIPDRILHSRIMALGCRSTYTYLRLPAVVMKQYLKRCHKRGIQCYTLSPGQVFDRLGQLLANLKIVTGAFVAQIFRSWLIQRQCKLFVRLGELFLPVSSKLLPARTVQ
ncbi:hypothetical protein D3C76_104090 [compost metagenome]